MSSGYRRRTVRRADVPARVPPASCPEVWQGPVRALILARVAARPPECLQEVAPPAPHPASYSAIRLAPRPDRWLQAQARTYRLAPYAAYPILQRCVRA